MYDIEDDGLDKKSRKKYYKIIRNACSAIGGGVGLILLKGFFSVEVEKAQDLFNGLGLWLIAFGCVVLLTAIFNKDWVFRINSILIFIVTPVVVVKLILAAM
jgi:hypothetical protein